MASGALSLHNVSGIYGEAIREAYYNCYTIHIFGVLKKHRVIHGMITYAIGCHAIDA